MIRAGYAIGLAVAAVSLLAVASGTSLEARRAELRERESLAQSAAVDVGAVLELRGRRERASLRERPRQDLIARVRGVMRDVGIADAGFSGIQAEGDGPVAADGGEAPAGFRAQSMRLALRGVSLRELGEFLARWRETQGLWTPTAIDLLPVAAKSRPSAPEGRDERFDVSVVLVSVYVASQAGRDGPKANGGTP